MMQNELYEIHVTGNGRPDEVKALLKTTLLSLSGKVSGKEIINIYDIPASPEYPHTMDTPPTGHDILHPKWMITARANSAKESFDIINRIREIISHYSLEVNIELEKNISADVKDDQISVSEYQGIESIADVPAYENHFVWKGKLTEIPSYNDIISSVRQSLNVSPHQLIDFINESGVVSRVATLYQPTRKTTLHYLVQNLALSPIKIIAEQVCFVGHISKR